MYTYFAYACSSVYVYVYVHVFCKCVCMTELNAVDAVLFEKVAEYIYKDIYVFETHSATSFNVLKQMNVISSNSLSECLLGLSF